MPPTELFRTDRLRAIAVIFLSLSLSQKTPAQQSRVTMLDFAAGSEMEDYLRAMQVAGQIPLYPWSIRGFSRAELMKLARADSAGPWALKSRLNGRPITAGPVKLRAAFNSAYPYGANDGAVWAGRGLTTSVSAGVTGYLGPLSIAINPVAFRAGNTSFDIVPNGRTGALAYNHATYTDAVDYPQRFGSASYSRVDPGESVLRFDSKILTLGVSTANEWIGPATEYPFLLGTNAPGFPHVFVGSGEPLNVWIGRVHARLMWGKLYQSEYSPVSGSTRFAFDTANGTVIQAGTIRLMTAGHLVFLPRGIPGLEVGIGRFIHVPNAPGEPSAAFLKKPLKVLFLQNEIAKGDTGGYDNQLASIFFRWVFPRSGLEVFGERGYEDQLYDLRDLILDIDHEREYMLGFQKTFRRAPNGIDVLRGELVNYQLPTIARVRFEGGIYSHTTLRQGHTNRGQLLGANPGVGWAAASTLAWTRYTPHARTTYAFRRIVRDQRGDFQVSGVVDPRSSDVIAAAGVERIRFGTYADLGAKFEVMRDFNRNFQDDVANLSLLLTVVLHPW